MSSIAPPAMTVAPLPLTLLDEHPDNPRKNSWQMPELVDSVRQHGILTPCIVRPYAVGDGKRFQILAGHRRVRAARALDLPSVPCSIVMLPDAETWTILLGENMQRRNLTVIEEARAYQGLRTRGLTVLAIANRLGCGEQRVSRRLALLELPEAEQDAISRGNLTLADAWKYVTRARAADQARQHGPAAGEGTGRHSKYNEHFNNDHELASDAQYKCDEAAHETPHRLGPACAWCWEETIRDDQHLVTQHEIFTDDEAMIEPRKADGAADEIEQKATA